MAGIFNILGKFFGNKSERDVRKASPILKKIHEKYDTLSVISNDDLRKKTEELKQIINRSIENEKKRNR